MNSVFPVKERKILTFLLGIFMHDVPSVVPLVSDSSVGIMWSVPRSQLLSVLVSVHLQKAVITYRITAHTWCMLLCLHLIFAGVWSQPLLRSYRKLRDKSGSVHPLGWTPAVALKIYLKRSADTCGLPPPSSREAVPQKHLCLTEQSAPESKKLCNNCL